MIQRIGFYTGLAWTGSFYLAMLSLAQPAWGFAGNVLGVLTIWIAGWQIRQWQQQEKLEFGIRHRWHMSLASHLLAALICTFGQYIYLRYLDEGKLFSFVSRMYSDPDVVQMLSPGSPAYKPSEMISLLQSMTLSQWTMEFLLLNAFIAIVLSIPTMFVARVKTKKTNL